MNFTIVNDSSHKLILLSNFRNALEYLHHKRNVTNLFAQKVGEAENPSKSRYILKLYIMKKLFLIPAMALLVVLGMSFTSLGSETDIQPEPVANDYVLLNGSWQSIPEQACDPGGEICQVQFGENGPVYDVYDEMDRNTRKSSTSEDPTIINP
ncbi:hypothetical protein LY54_03302 [Salegentibacter mishustinae]|jgi:hypothetical protein|nr:hypothetical protein LY54_03302 [Salegentibacter mishustinae]GGX00725.1 hypothetical protein GCM10008086_32240 [Salegentibacter mishustinae]|tara:strand:- start:1996 stop:2454 length:459 start_codon:yes stop_codon:yes gene_type:complete